MADAPPKIIVLDDDPTGSQTVHSCLLLTQWDVETLRVGLRDDSPIFFILTNTRSLPASEALKVTREVCQHLKQAIAAEGIQDYLVVSRSDSTLRGHYPIETDAIAAELGPFDAHFLVPAFFEGGRFTRESIHYLMMDGVPTPVHQTEFAKDSVFSYRHSYLPDYVAEKTAGKIPAASVKRFLLPEIRQGCLPRLMQLNHNQCGVVDAETQSDLDRFAQDLLTAATQGKKFLFRSAASLLTALAQLPPQPTAPEAMSRYVRGDQPGVFLVGSHVNKTTAQLKQLLQEDGVSGVELDLTRMRDQVEVASVLKEEAIARVRKIFEAGQTPVVFTSRDELTFADEQTRLEFGLRVSDLLMDILRGLPKNIGYLVSKGGITSNDTLSRGLSLPTARLLGQIIPGCSVICTPDNHPQFPTLPVVLFPGNVGDNDGLLTVRQRFCA